MSTHRTAALAIVLFAGSWVAFAADPAGLVRYDDYQVVRVENRSWEQIEALHGLGAQLLSCHEGVGPVEYVVPRARVAEIASLNVNFRVLHENVQALIDAERAEIEAAGQADPRDAAWFTAYKDPNAIYAKLLQMATDRPQIATLLDVGTTLEGRHIWGLKITGPGAGKPGVLFNGAQHAREWVSPMVNMWIADRLVYEYGDNIQLTALVNSLEFFIVPVVNPDGYAFTWSSNRLWRKNRHVFGTCIGVDNNRNWGAGWGGEGAGTSPCDETYRGPSAFSELETQALRDLFIANPSIASTIDFHSYSQLIMSPYAYTSALPPDHDIFMELNQGMHDALQAVHGVSYTYGPIYTTIYPASGGTVDWCYIDQGIFSFTIELRPSGAGGGGFELPASEIIPTCEENFAAAMHLASWSTSPVKITFPQGTPSTILDNQPNPVSVTIRVISGALDPASPTLMARRGGSGPFTAYPLEALGGTQFRALLPATPCGQTLQYYVVASSGAGVQGVAPSGAPDSVFSSESIHETVSLADSFETDLGWTASVSGATAGAWQRGVPVNDPGWAYDPLTDGDGSGRCFLTQNAVGNTDVDGGSVILISPQFDLSGGAASIKYSYYLYLTNSGAGDALKLHISANGTTGPWVLLANHNTDGGTAWRTNTITPAQLQATGLTLTSNMRLRFTANDADPQSIVEAGVDGVRVAAVGCVGPALCAGDLDCDGAVGFFDIDPLVLAFSGEAAYLAQFPNCQWLNGDTNNDQTVDFFDIDPFIALLGMVCP